MPLLPFYLSLSQEIADGVTKSAQAVQAAEAGVRQLGAVAREQTICMSYSFIIIFYIFNYLQELGVT